LIIKYIDKYSVKECDLYMKFVLINGISHKFIVKTVDIVLFLE